jgi:hypothetical protein
MLRFQVSDDEKWIVLLEHSDDVEKKQIEISLTKKIHNFYFHPLVKKKLWTGDICFIEKKGGFWKIPIGLWREILQIGEEYSLKIDIKGLDKIIIKDFSLEDFTEWVNEFFDGGIGGDPSKMPRDYQIEAAWKIIKYRYSVSEVATSSGKTLISFMVLAYLKSKGLIRKYLMIVPTTNLVFQGNDDFIDYGLDKLDGSRIQQIGGGSKLRGDCDVIIGTFQSLVKKEEDFFEEVDVVFVDECLYPNSLIEMSDNTFKKISDVNKGDIVKTINDKTGKKEDNEVDYVYKNLNKGYQIYEIETEDGKILKLTGNHKVKLKNGLWKKVEDLNLSDELFDI